MMDVRTRIICHFLLRRGVATESQDAKDDLDTEVRFGTWEEGRMEVHEPQVKTEFDFSSISWSARGRGRAVVVARSVGRSIRV